MQALGLLGALSPIIWFTCFTAIVIVTKTMLGAHPQERVPLGTRAYLSWWYLNAMLNVWECVGGTWLLDTKMIIFIYRCMGAKVRGPLIQYGSCHNGVLTRAQKNSSLKEGTRNSCGTLRLHDIAGAIRAPRVGTPSFNHGIRKPK